MTKERFQCLLSLVDLFLSFFVSSTDSSRFLRVRFLIYQSPLLPFDLLPSSSQQTFSILNPCVSLSYLFFYSPLSSLLFFLSSCAVCFSPGSPFHSRRRSPRMFFLRHQKASSARYSLSLSLFFFNLPHVLFVFLSFSLQGHPLYSRYLVPCWIHIAWSGGFRGILPALGCVNCMHHVPGVFSCRFFSSLPFSPFLSGGIGRSLFFSPESHLKYRLIYLFLN